MSRGRKLLIVGLVLAVGFGLAWPFRHVSTDRETGHKTFKSVESVAKTPAIEPSQAKATKTRQFASQPPQIGSPAPHVVARMTSIGDRGVVGHKSSPIASFDLANHPALAAPLARRAVSPVTPAVPPEIQVASESNFPVQTQKSRADARPAYATTDRAFYAEEQREAEIRHVVQNNDTLEKIAKRYLGDEGRALEIFDMNRDLLDNPHLLPIDAELRIPADLRKMVD